MLQLKQMQSLDTLEVMGVMVATEVMVAMDIMERGRLMLSQDIIEAMEAMVDMVVAMDIMERDLLKQDTTEDMVVIEALVVDMDMDIMVKYYFMFVYYFPPKNNFPTKMEINKYSIDPCMAVLF